VTWLRYGQDDMSTLTRFRVSLDTWHSLGQRLVPLTVPLPLPVPVALPVPLLSVTVA
jgi:hypothetical protein